MGKFTSGLYNRLVIVIPYAWLLLFFLAPFLIVFRISMSTTAIAMPPYEPVFTFADGWAGLLRKLSELSFDNYTYLTDDPLYFN
ncbi:putrescine/spermidine ABC transporter permease, partial [Rhizobium ruizarguesonis]